jgi:hypothetical protein
MFLLLAAFITPFLLLLSPSTHRYVNKMVPNDIKESALAWAIEQLAEEDDDSDEDEVFMAPVFFFLRIGWWGSRVGDKFLEEFKKSRMGVVKIDGRRANFQKALDKRCVPF